MVRQPSPKTKATQCSSQCIATLGLSGGLDALHEPQLRLDQALDAVCELARGLLAAAARVARAAAGGQELSTTRCGAALRDALPKDTTASRSMTCARARPPTGATSPIAGTERQAPSRWWPTSSEDRC